MDFDKCRLRIIPDMFKSSMVMYLCLVFTKALTTYLIYSCRFRANSWCNFWTLCLVFSIFADFVSGFSPLFFLFSYSLLKLLCSRLSFFSNFLIPFVSYCFVPPYLALSVWKHYIFNFNSTHFIINKHTTLSWAL